MTDCDRKFLEGEQYCHDFEKRAGQATLVNYVLGNRVLGPEE